MLRRLGRDGPDRLAGFAREGRLRRRIVIDRYLDTADGALERAEARARLREARSGVVLTVKRRGVEDGPVTAREELEGPATSDVDPARWPQSSARESLLRLAGESQLVEVVRLRQLRAIRMLRRGETLVEVSLDQLEALDGELAIATRWELEAELKAGSRARLAELADVLLAMPGVAPALGSKRAFALDAVGAAFGQVSDQAGR